MNEVESLDGIDLFKLISEYVHHEKYEELETLVVNNKVRITPILLSILYDVPVNKNMMVAYGNLFKVIIEVSTRHKQFLSLRDSIRLQTIKLHMGE